MQILLRGVGGLFVLGFVVILSLTVLLLMLTIQPGESSTIISLRVITSLAFIYAIGITTNGYRRLNADSFIDHMQNYFGFNARSLQLNRAGRLSAGQLLRLSFGTLLTLIVTLSVGALIIFVGINYQSQVENLAGVFIGLAGVTFIAYGLRQLVRLIGDLRAGIQQMTGTLSAFSKRKAGTYSNERYRSIKRYYLRVEPIGPGEAQIFPVDHHIRRLVQSQTESTRYIIYYLPRRQVLLSLEMAPRQSMK